jgi:HPt (histidine-containing phosphotransfer) domain-containing protein
MTSPTANIIDEAILDAYRALQEPGQADVVTEFIDLFLEDLPARLGQLKTAITNRDPKAVRSAAHALKGSGSSIGANRLASVCGELEALGRAGSVDGIDGLATSVEIEATAAAAALQRLRK